MSNFARLVMVIDDEESVRVALKRLLRSAGYEVRTFSSAQQLLAHGRPSEPCCLVLDVCMPGLDGLEFQRSLLERGVNLPVIILTGHGDVSMSVAAMKAGAIDFLPKPFDPEELLAAVARAIQVDAQTLTDNFHLREVRDHFALLTAREREVFHGVVAGMLNKQIAADLGITEKTVKIHRGRVMEKMNVESLADLVRAAEAMEHARRGDLFHAHVDAVAHRGFSTAG